ncbi:MAG: hypothetical protein ACLGI3_02080 [Actinomycetes bacterium]
MRSSKRAGTTPRPDPRVQAREDAFTEMRAHELFGPMLRRIHPDDVDGWGVRSSALRRNALLAVDAHGGLVFNGRAEAATCEWTWAIAHGLTHLGLGHADAARRDGRGSYADVWRAACCLAVNRFLGSIGIPGAPDVPGGFDGAEEALAARFTAGGIPRITALAGPAGRGPDLWENLHEGRRAAPAEAASVWARTFADGLTAFDGATAVGAVGRRPELTPPARALGPGRVPPD